MGYDFDNCATSCHGKLCGEECKGYSCAKRCIGRNCGVKCHGENCASGCIGRECGSHCVGHSCAKNCIGPNCGRSCSEQEGTLTVTSAHQCDGGAIHDKERALEEAVEPLNK